MSNLKRTTLLLTAIVLIGSEVLCYASEDLVAPLEKLTKSIQAKIRYDHSIDVSKMTDKQLIAEATKNDPPLANVFVKKILRLLRNNRHIIVLVCSPDGKKGEMEDASWTPGVDILWFHIDPNHPADFSLKLSDAPAQPAR
ncbi:MAG: hypothetical protein NT105_16430 [Verrucomicrobia bacterium]|nr:hypothetical protein [Verrucomicrobiota bacterium]